MYEYEIGNYVSKPVTGVCRIENILYLDANAEKSKKLYYLLIPIDDQKGKIYVPVSNSQSSLRACMTEEEAWDLIARMPEIQVIWINNERMREQKYREVIKSNSPEALVSVIKMLYQRKLERSEQGRKSTSSDERYFQMAENLLHMELGVALGKPKEKICQLIIDSIDK